MDTKKAYTKPVLRMHPWQIMIQQGSVPNPIGGGQSLVNVDATQWLSLNF